jgi:galactitol-specific phosphotransferase system IIC component
VLALTADSVLPLSGAVAIALLVAGLVVAFVVKAVVMKVIGLALTVVMALLIWSQRTELKDCADKVGAGIEAVGTEVDETCRFFGRDVRVKLPGEPDPPPTTTG